MSEGVTLRGVGIWLLALLFFFYEFFLRVFLGTIAADLTIQLNLTASQFSAIGAGYYITYGVMQVPVGLLTEKWGARSTLTMACLFCSAGVFLMALAHGFWLAFVSRLIIGFGSAFAFVSLLLLVLKWFPRKHFSFVSGLSIFWGAVGPLLAGAPLAWLYQVTNHNWRGLLLFSGLFGIVLAFSLLVFVRSAPEASKRSIVFLEQQRRIFDLVVEMLKNGQVWVLIAYSSFTYLVLPLFAAYFGTLFLQARGFQLTTAATVVSMQWIGYAVGSPLFGKWSDRIKRRKPFLLFAAFGGFFVSLAILYFPVDQVTWLGLLFGFLGLAVSGQSLTFACIVEHVKPKLHSSGLGVNNAAAMLSSAVWAVIVGFVIQKGGGQFSSFALTKGLTLIPFFFVIAFFIALCAFRETFCRQQQQVHTLHKFSEIFG